MRASLILLPFIFATTTVFAATPTDQSIDTLLEVTKAESMIDSTMANMEQMVRQGMVQATAGKTLTEEQTRMIRIAPGRIVLVMRQQMSWASMKPMYIQLYKESFDQSEIDGLIEFYRSPLGQSFITKMPIVMQKSMTLMQTQMQQFLPKLQESMKQALEEAKVTH